MAWLDLDDHISELFAQPDTELIYAVAASRYIAKKNAYIAEWRKLNPEKIKEYEKKYRCTDHYKEISRKASRKWKTNNVEKRKAYQREYYQKNKEKCKSYMRSYRKKANEFNKISHSENGLALLAK